ncbi:MAG: indolepyruvate ferredoxin oxidoreductase subunit alpha [Bacteriovoracaceae bacterium]
MTPYLEINSLCVGCDACRVLCPEKSIIIADGSYYIEKWSCTLCGICGELCPTKAIKLKSSSDDFTVESES